MNNEYILVKHIPPVKDARKNPVFHNQYMEYSGVLGLTIKAITPVFVGTGNVEIDSLGIYLQLAKVNGIPVIPGSSLKGVIRSTAEALSPSCLGAKCDPKGKLCPACSIFGTTGRKAGYQSRVFMEDVILDGTPTEFLEVISIDERWSPQLDHPDSRKFFPHYSQVKIGRDRVEVVKTGAIFKSTLRFFNLEKWEIGLLLLSLGVSSTYLFFLKLGGAKGKGLGSVKISINGNYATGTDFIERRFESFDATTLDKFVNEYLEQASLWGVKDSIIQNINKFSQR